MERLYTRDHTWVEFQNDGTAKLGITDFAQSELGEIIFVEPPSVGENVKSGKVFAYLESTKAVANALSPIDGTVCEKNDKALDYINEDPLGDGWICMLKDVACDRATLLTQEQYASMLNK